MFLFVRAPMQRENIGGKQATFQDFKLFLWLLLCVVLYPLSLHHRY